MTDTTGPLTPAVDIRRAGDRFKTNLFWLDSKHSFSFSRHYDPLRRTRTRTWRSSPG
jgi:hypothetical protein